MGTDFESNKEKIISELEKRAGDFSCPICSKKKFILGGGYFAHDLQDDLSKRHIGGVNIPTVPVICSNCGFVAEFAAGTLGVLPKPKTEG